MRRHNLVLAGGLLLLVGACSGRKQPKVEPAPVAAPAPSTPVDVMYPLDPAARLYYDDAGAFPDSARLIIRDAESLQDIWTRAASGQASVPPLPAVDWSRQMVVLVSAGRMQPGDQIRVDSVGTRGGRPVVVVRTTVECQPFPATAYPFEIVRVRRSEGPMEFEERRDETGDCDS